jgi:hypothetical protein
VDPRQAFLVEELARGRLHSSLTEKELENRLIKIYRAARSSLQEGGANTLFIALGFLRWFEAPSATKERMAPLLLLPLELVRGSAREPFRLRRSEDEVRLNVTLIQKLEREHGVRFEGLDELPEDESGLDIPRIFQRFRRAVVSVDRFEVVERAVIGLFSFTKFLMWRDLEDRSLALMTSPVVRALIEGMGGEELSISHVELPDPRELDRLISPAEMVTVVDADSSQLAAVVAASQGMSFVLEGPPGTGKSQTITNLIGHCLAQGQRVLFVSEKMAALSVVQRRLEQVGLGPFCLELHSNKARKAEVLRQLGEALEASGTPNPRSWERNAEQIATFRRELNGYVRPFTAPEASASLCSR